MDRKEQQITEQYVATIPAECPCKYPGVTESVISIICALISVLFFPPVFGITGILLGMKAKEKGAKTLGLVAIILSAILMTAGILIGVSMSLLENSVSGSAGGFMGIIISL